MKRKPAGDSVDSNRVTICLGAKMMREVRAEAERLERPMSWIVQRAWRLAHARMRAARTQA